MKSLTILQMNDTHAYTDLHTEMFIENGKETYRKAGGYARIATLLERCRKEQPDAVFAFDNGDTFHGTYSVIATKGEGLVPILNEMKFDAMTAHWEFAYGPKQVEKLTDMLDYPMLACNCYQKDTNEHVFPSHTVIERSGVKIGVIGIAEHIVDKTMPPHFSEGIYFTLGVDELPDIIDELKRVEQVDLVIVLSHFGFPQEVKLAGEVDGIDVLLSGHTHNALHEPVKINDTIIIQSGCHGAYIGRLDVVVENRKIVSYAHELIEVAESIEQDEKIASLIEVLKAPYQSMLEQEVGQTNTALHRYNQLETTMDNFLLEALLDVSDAQFAFSNGWRYGAPIPVGPITMEDLWNMIPTNPPVSMVELTGEELLQMLEENLENTFSGNPYHQMGGYVKRCLGLKMYIKIENPKGTRIQHLFIGDEKVQKDAVYKAAFVTVQGVPKKYGANRQQLSIHAIDALKQYIEKSGTIDVHLHQTIQLV